MGVWGHRSGHFQITDTKVREAPVEDVAGALL